MTMVGRQQPSSSTTKIGSIIFLTCHGSIVRLATLGIIIAVSTLVHPSFSFVLPDTKIDLRRRGHCQGKQQQQPYGQQPSNLFMAPVQGTSNNNDKKKKNTDDGMTVGEIKRQLTEYLQKRLELNADQTAQEVKGKVVGGTRGNAILDFVSGAPVKEQIIDRAPNVFDYDELSKYGYSHLVTPIMDQVGGRRAVYELMDMEPPPLLGPPPKKMVPKLVIDRTGAEDKARYSGLKMGQVLDDSTMAEALERANRMAKEGKGLRPKLMEEEYVQPFADGRNVSPPMTPDWTPERLDEYAKMQGRAQAWARRARMGEFVTDPNETLDMPLTSRVYSILTAFWMAFAFGRATPSFLMNVVGGDHGFHSVDDVTRLTATLQIPGLALAVMSVGSGVVCAALLAPERNRSVLIWALKGFLGGPLSILQLRELGTLITREQEEKNQSTQRRNG